MTACATSVVDLEFAEIVSSGSHPGLYVQLNHLLASFVKPLYSSGAEIPRRDLEIPASADVSASHLYVHLNGRPGVTSLNIITLIRLISWREDRIYSERPVRRLHVTWTKQSHAENHDWGEWLNAVVQRDIPVLCERYDTQGHRKDRKSIRAFSPLLKEPSDLQPTCVNIFCETREPQGVVSAFEERASWLSIRLGYGYT